MRAGFYKVDLNKTEWEVPERYQMLSPVGSGAYGQVWFVLLCLHSHHNFNYIIKPHHPSLFCSSAVDTKTDNKVAIKKLARPFQSAIHAKRTYRELRLLKHMNHENVIGLLDVFTPASSLSDFQVLVIYLNCFFLQ